MIARSNRAEVRNPVLALPAHHPVENWKYEVVNGDTRLGYWDWVAIRDDGLDPHPNSPRVH